MKDLAGKDPRLAVGKGGPARPMVKGVRHVNQALRPTRPMVFGLFGPRGRSDLGAFRPPSSPSRYVSSDAFSQAKVLSVPGKRELTVPAREAPPTVETDLMELDMYFVGTPLGQSFF